MLKSWDQTKIKTIRIQVTETTSTTSSSNSRALRLILSSKTRIKEATLLTKISRSLPSRAETHLMKMGMEITPIWAKSTKVRTQITILSNSNKMEINFSKEASLLVLTLLLTISSKVLQLKMSSILSWWTNFLFSSLNRFSSKALYPIHLILITTTIINRVAILLTTSSSKISSKMICRINQTFILSKMKI